MTFFNSILYNHIHILSLSISIKNIYSNSISSKYKIMLNIFFPFISIGLQCNIRGVFLKIIYIKYIQKIFLYTFLFLDFRFFWFKHYISIFLFCCTILIMEYKSYISKNLYYVIVIIPYILIGTIEKTIHFPHIIIILLYFHFFHI
jgi:hypothetical protein